MVGTTDLNLFLSSFRLSVTVLCPGKMLCGAKTGGMTSTIDGGFQGLLG
jgi:hypothetical protein